MVYVGKVYKHEKDENFERFVASLGLPEDKAKLVLNHKSIEKLAKNGDEYILSSTSPSGTRDVKFQDGVEFDEEISAGIVSKSIFKVNGNVIVQEQKFGDGRSLTFKREYSPDKLILSRTIFKVNGDEVVQEQKFADGRVLTYKREYSPDKLIVTLTASFWDGSAVRHYVAE